MERSGVLSPLTREIVIDRVMALETDDITLDQLKWVMLMVLFNQPGQETAYDFLENMVFDDMQGHLH
jgi:Smg protein